MPESPFEKKRHVYRNDAFAELVKNAIHFFNHTPVHSLPLSEKFLGSGVYALYYTGDNPIYIKYAQLNRLSCDYPLYVGKAVPKGWRQSRTSDESANPSSGLYNRLKEHGKSISEVEGINLEHFKCRFVIFEEESSDMISTVEALLIKINKPLWNSVLDGFGNHDPGSGRSGQAQSDWDVIHPGRKWAERLTGTPNQKRLLFNRIKSHLKTLGEK